MDGQSSGSVLLIINAVLGTLVVIWTGYVTLRKDENTEKVKRLETLTNTQGAHIAQQDRKLENCEEEKNELRRDVVVAKANIFALQQAMKQHGIPFQQWDRVDVEANEAVTKTGTHVPLPPQPPPEART